MTAVQVLTVENAGITAKDLQAELQTLGCPVTVASGASAIEKPAEPGASLVLMHTWNGPIAGIAIVSELRARFGTAEACGGRFSRAPVLIFDRLPHLLTEFHKIAEVLQQVKQ
jgi:CheY-like chemotaxis protein